MSIKADYEFLFVGRDDNSFLENYSYDLFQEHGERSGEIFINLEIQNNPVDAEEIGAVIFETMEKVFFADMDAEPYTRFESALKAVNNVLAEFKSQKVSAYIGNLNVVVSAIVDNQLLLAQCGDAEAYLIRKRYVSIVSEGLSEEAEASEDVFASIASGEIEPGDFVLFSSTRLLRYISKTDLAQSVHKGSVGESLDEIKDVISTEILGKVGLTGILFSKVTVSDVESIGDEVDSATKSILESNESYGSSHRERMTGKFLNVFKKFKRNRPEVFQGGSGISQWLKDFWAGLFDKGFGKNKILALLVLVILVLLVGIIFANGQNAKKTELEKLDTVLNSVQTKIAEAETKGAYDKEVAKSILDKAYLDAKSVLESGEYREKAGLYLLQIEETRDKLDNVLRIENPKVLADLSLKRSDVNALGFALVGDRVFAYDSNGLYEIVLDQVQDPLTIDDEETVIAATGFDDRNSVVFLTKSGKLIEYKEGTMSFMDTEDGVFHKGVALEDWSNKLYILDSAGNQLWKYTYKGIKNTFGAAEKYIADETDVSQAVDVAIDSNVYLLNNNGDLFKFYAGNKAEFYVNNPPFTMFKDPKIIYTTDKLNQIYVLDSREARVLVYSKDSKTGNVIYTSQYLFPDVGDLRDVYVNPDTKKMYVLTESKILEADL